MVRLSEVLPVRVAQICTAVSSSVTFTLLGIDTVAAVENRNIDLEIIPQGPRFYGMLKK